MKLPRIFSLMAILLATSTAHASFTPVNQGSHLDGAIDASAGGKTLSIDAGASADLLIVGTSTEFGSGSSFTATYAGNPMTLATGNGAQSNIFYLDLTSTSYAGGDADLVLSWDYTAGGDLGVGWVSVNANLGPSGSVSLHSTASSAASASVDLVTTENTFNFVNFNGNKGDNLSNLLTAPLSEIYSDGAFGSNAGAAGYQSLAAAGSHTYFWAHAPASALRRIDAVAFSATGQAAVPLGLSVETWNQLSQGDSLVILQQEGISSGAADSTSTIADARFSGHSVAGSGTRLRGMLTPQVTDTYTFWVSGADNVALWISENDSRFNKRLVAYHLGSTNADEWDKHPHQKSLPIQLTGGQSYYLEAQVMDEDGGGQLSVAWRGQQGQYCLSANGAVATQSSTKWSCEASRANDGNTSGVWSKGELTLTQDQPNSWIHIDFQQDRSVNQVKLYNNVKESNWDNLSNFRISLLDANDAELLGQDFFTTSGNAGLEFTWNTPAMVEQVRKVKVQLLGNNLNGNGSLSLAEIECSGNGLGYIVTRELISSTYLTTLQPDADDANDNNLSDAWEAQTGLASSPLPGALLEYGDPDGDGLSNYQEQSYGSDPLVQEDVANGLTRYIWMGVDTAHVANLITKKKFYDYPNAVEIVPGIDDALYYKRFGARYRGKIIAPVDGQYRFWISGDSDAELWLADGAFDDPSDGTPLINRFGKRRIAITDGITPYRDFDYSTKQRSEWIELQAGGEYYLEVLHSNQTSHMDHVTVAWQKPGAEREIIPASAFVTETPEAGDADDDNLPDSWETDHALSATDNGFTDFHQGQYGDPDADGLTNLEEYQYGTDPYNADSDGDGYSDSQEIKHYGSDPRVSNNLAPVALSLPALNQYSGATGSWSVDASGALTSMERRGTISYSFTLDQAGVHEVILEGASLSGSTSGTIHTPITFTLDNDQQAFARRTLTSMGGQSASVRAITPWLAAGNHTLTLFHDQYDASMRLRIDALTISRLGGADLDSDGIADWVEAEMQNANALTHVPATSRTSPLSIQGVTEQFSGASLTSLAPGATQPQSLVLTDSIDTSFFAELELDESGPVTLDASLANGAVTESHSITWTATNLFEPFADSTLHIRQGDALLLDAWSGSAADGQPFTVTLDGTLLEDASLNTTHTSGQSFVARFETAGSFSLVASHGGNSATVSLEVHAADFGPDYSVLTGNTRSWTPPVLGVDAVVQADSALVFNETTNSPTSVPRIFSVKAELAENRHVVARMPDNVDGAPSAVLTQGTFHAFSVAGADLTKDTQVITQYPDGTWLLKHTVIGVNLPPDAVIEIIIQMQGAQFTSGGTVLELRASDFDANGMADVYYEVPDDGGQAPKLCHVLKASLED